MYIPKELFTDEKYKEINNDSKLLFGLLLDKKNQSKDEYIIFPRQEIETILNCSHKKVVNLFKELKEVGLIEEIRQGLTKPNLIHIENFSNNAHSSLCATYKKIKQPNK